MSKRIKFSKKDQSDLLEEYVFSRTIKQLKPRLDKLSDDLKKKIIKFKIQETDKYDDIIQVICDDTVMCGVFLKETGYTGQSNLVSACALQNVKVFQYVLKHMTTNCVYLDCMHVPRLPELMVIAIKHQRVNVSHICLYSGMQRYLSHYFDIERDCKHILEIFKLVDLPMMTTTLNGFNMVNLFRTLYISVYKKFTRDAKMVILLQFPESRYNNCNWKVTFRDVISRYKYMTNEKQKAILFFMLYCNRIRKQLGVSGIAKDNERTICALFVENHLNKL